MEHSFVRTSCACDECVACCKQQPGPLAPSDVGRIVAHLVGSEPIDIATLFWASPGAVVKNTATGQTFMVGTITPQLRDGRCVFLLPNDRCAIHDVAPFGCAFVDPHMAPNDAHRRAVWLYRTIAGDGDYQALRRSLPPATSWNPRGFGEGDAR